MDLSCTFTHYETQPMPNPLGWFAHHATPDFHRMEVAITFLLYTVLTILCAHYTLCSLYTVLTTHCPHYTLCSLHTVLTTHCTHYTLYSLYASSHYTAGAEYGTRRSRQERG
jgi:hypothetical protein